MSLKTDIIRQRLHNRRLEGAKSRTPAEVVAWMGAVQGQEYAYAKWALGMRIEDGRDEAVEKAFNRRRPPTCCWFWMNTSCHIEIPA